MAKRFRMSRGKSRRQFSHSGSHTHVKNLNIRPMRGGIRL